MGGSIPNHDTSSTEEAGISQDSANGGWSQALVASMDIKMMGDDLRDEVGSSYGRAYFFHDWPTRRKYVQLCQLHYYNWATKPAGSREGARTSARQ